MEIKRTKLVFIQKKCFSEESVARREKTIFRPETGREVRREKEQKSYFTKNNKRRKRS